jgi:hypothetical protein
MCKIARESGVVVTATFNDVPLVALPAFTESRTVLDQFYAAMSAREDAAKARTTRRAAASIALRRALRAWKQGQDDGGASLDAISALYRAIEELESAEAAP